MLQSWILCTLSAFTCLACIWDRDTLAEEAKGRPETAKVIIGWFNQYPARYYEMRLERVSQQLEAGQINAYQYWDLIDDAAVACDRLGRHDEAIAWMEKKAKFLAEPNDDQSKEHRYRYLANLGTFYAHKWVSLPAETRNADLSLLKQAETLIAQAIEENPDAHFGREIYQLEAIRWLISKPLEDQWTYDTFIPRHFSEDAGKDVDGITGLIQLGAAWKSLDVFHTLTSALESNREAVLAELCYNRELELYNAGARTIHPDTEVAEVVVPRHARTLETELREGVADFYPKARKAAIARNEAWLAYQNERYDKGMHPDTHPHFWNDWQEPDMPDFPGITAQHLLGNEFIFMILLFSAITLIGYLLLRGLKALISRHQARAA